MCFAALSRSVNNPVDSNTTSTPRSFHGSCAGSLTDSTWNSSLFTEMRSPEAEISAFRFPRMESYFSRWARVWAFVRSFTATKSRLLSPIAARMMLRPMRPNPLIPTLIAISRILQQPETADFNERLARWSNSRVQLPELIHVRGLQRSHRRVLRGDVAVPDVSGGALPQVRGQPAAAAGHPAGVVQSRRRRFDLDPRGLGRRGAHRPRAPPSAPRTLSKAPHLPVDNDDDGPADRAQQPSIRRRGVFLPLRFRLHRQANASAGEAEAVHHDGDGDLAEPASCLQRRRGEDDAGERSDLVEVLPEIPDGPVVLPSGACARRPLLHAERRIGAAHHRNWRRSGPRLRHRLAQIRFSGNPRYARRRRRRSRTEPSSPVFPNQSRSSGGDRRQLAQGRSRADLRSLSEDSRDAHQR